MARILEGPLAASISGSVGNLTFERTKFGQIVQTKPVPPVHTSPAALLTKDRFRTAMASWGRLWWNTKIQLTFGATERKENPQQAWVSAIYRLQQGRPWALDSHTIPNLRLIISSATFTAPNLEITTNLDGSPLQILGRLIILQNFIPVHWSGTFEIYPLTVPAHVEDISPIVPPFHAILFAFFFPNSSDYGQSDIIFIP